MLITKRRSEIAAPWWSRMKMEGGPAYLCANETDARERANWEYRIKEKNFWSEILEKARRDAIGLNSIDLNYDHRPLCLLIGKKNI